MDLETVLSPAQQAALLQLLQARFEQHPARHPGIAWATVQARLAAQPEKLVALNAMERTGGEPDVIAGEAAEDLFFYDCAAESPAGRRNTCYDAAGQAEREKRDVHPAGNAVGLAAAMGIELLTEAQYRTLQRFGRFDTKTSSWLHTPADIRQAGGAIFADYRYGHVFVYHNSAPSFYSSRGFRGRLRV
jgi:hypothetical protein